MRLAELRRYPVKSLAGERLAAVDVDVRGLEGDRLWALVDREGGIASGKTTRRFRKVPGMLHHRSHLEDGQPVVMLADGRSARAIGAADEGYARRGVTFVPADDTLLLLPARTPTRRAAALPG